jgi:hypothetical protein
METGPAAAVLSEMDSAWVEVIALLSSTMGLLGFTGIILGLMVIYGDH